MLLFKECVHCILSAVCNRCVLTLERAGAWDADLGYGGEIAVDFGLKKTAVRARVPITLTAEAVALIPLISGWTRRLSGFPRFSEFVLTRGSETIEGQHGSGCSWAARNSDGLTSVLRLVRRVRTCDCSGCRPFALCQHTLSAGGHDQQPVIMMTRACAREACNTSRAREPFTKERAIGPWPTRCASPAQFFTGRF